MRHVEVHEVQVDKNGFTVKAALSDKELVLRALRNVPCGLDRKQAEVLIKDMEAQQGGYTIASDE